MKAVVLPHRLALAMNPQVCDVCSAHTAVWELDRRAVCSACYLYRETSVGRSDAFAHLLAEVRSDTGEGLSVVDGALQRIEDADRVLGALVLMQRFFGEEGTDV